MEAVKLLNEDVSELELDQRTDLEELEELVYEMRLLRRKKDNIIKKEIKRCMAAKKLKMVKDDISFEIAALHKTYAYLEKSYRSLYKICHPKGNNKTVGNEVKPDMSKLKNQQSTIGEIIRTIPKNNKDGE